MKRREFITLLGGAAAAWPLAARAQPSDRMRRIGVLMATAADEPESQARLAAFLQALQQLGWTDGRNLRIEYRWSAGDASRLRRDAAELVALAPDVVLAGVGATATALLEASRTVPIVFVQSIDPVGSGLVESLARPGGNGTGFIQFEYSLSGKWLELLKEVAPQVTRVGILREPGSAGIGQWAIIQAVANSLDVELKPIGLPDAGEIERYGPDITGQYRRAASYVDRILKGEKPGDLPVQRPTKYELVINLKAAKALGLEVPPTLLARGDEVIE